MIAIPGAVGRHVAPELFRSEWAANVLVVPEDRSGPEGANVLADTPGFQPSHAAHSLACLTDLWTMPPGRRSSLIDAVKPRPGSPDPVRVVPVRCYSRIVDLGYLADHLAAAVFRRRETSWPNPDRERFDRVEDPVELLEYATRAMADIPGLRPIGTAASKASVLSFVIPGTPNERIAQHLDRQGIAVRAGHHCAQPAIRRFGLETSVRPSLAFYNTRDEVDALVRALRSLKRS